MGKVVCIWLFVCSALAAQWPPGPIPTQFSSNPFFIKNTWYIGGAGAWDMMTLDPAAGRLYIAHGPVVQVVDVSTGALVGEIRGFGRARAIALDTSGQLGYITDGVAGRVVVFDRSSLDTVAEIPTKPSPRALVYEPRTHLLFAVEAASGAQPAASPQGRRAEQRNAPTVPYRASYITVIDTQTNKVLGQILVAGVLGYAHADGAGQVYIGYTDRDAILHFSAAVVENQLKQMQPAKEEEEAAAPFTGRPEPAPQVSSQPAFANPAPAKPVEWVPPTLDWTMPPDSNAAAEAGLHLLSLGRSCGVPHSFALDGPDDRLFAACENQTLEVLNTNTGQPVTTVPIGWGVNQIGYDPVRGLIYAATGAGDGELTVIRRNNTDTYAVIQDLPTRRRAYVMAVDSATGNVYLVTNLMGVDLTKPGGIGTLRMTPIQGSFAVLEIGH